MRLIPVESSHIAAIGYLDEQSVLLVLYKDGALYARPGWSMTDYIDLTHASSKGKFLHTRGDRLGSAVLITK